MNTDDTMRRIEEALSAYERMLDASWGPARTKLLATIRAALPQPDARLPKIELRSYDGKLDEVVASAPGGVWVHLEDMGGSWFLMIKVGDSEVFLNIQSEEAVVTDAVGEVAKLDRPSGDEPVSVPYTLAESAAEAPKNTR